MAQFDYFVVFAEMRTGSNFLETNINAFDGLSCVGEAFNPHFIGYPKRDNILGVTQAERDSDPDRLLKQIRANPAALTGFRFFNDHDPRALDICLPDPLCAKIILTRNPVESYVSWKIAQATGQWKLTNIKHARAEKIQFEPQEFAAHLAALQEFQVRLLNGLQRSGQTAFYLAYEDLQDVEVMNGLAAYLGCDARLESLDKSLKKQNPSPLPDKVKNYEEMEAALGQIDHFNLTRTPNFEPRRGPAVPTFVGAATSPLLFLPIRSGPEVAVRQWLAGLDGVNDDDLLTGFNQKTIRQWKRQRPGHRSFTVIRHPVARAHAAFCDRILQTGPGCYGEIRATLRRQFKLPIPANSPDDTYDRQAHHAAFLQFLGFLRGNLASQTGIRVDAAWATQAAILQGFSNFVLPDLILREDRLADDLAILAAQVGKETMPQPSASSDPHATLLSEIYTAEIEEAARAVYQRDYMTFGFGDWA